MSFHYDGYGRKIVKTTPASKYYYYYDLMGRWTSPDYSDAPVAVPYADLTNPQTLNLYALVRDNPETFADLDGHDLGGGDADAGAEISQAFGDLVESGRLDIIRDFPVCICAGPQGQSTTHKVAQSVKHFVKTHPKTVKAAIITVQVVTAISGILDDGASEALLPEEEAVGEALEAGADDAAEEIPGNPYRGADAAEQASKHLDQFHGIKPEVASERLHQIKEAAGLGPAQDVVIGRTGDVYNANTGELIGSLTQSH